MAGTAAQRRKAAGWAIERGNPAQALAYLKAVPDPTIRRAQAKHIVDAFLAGGFSEARVDIRGYDFEPFTTGDLSELGREANGWPHHGKRVALVQRPGAGWWLVIPTPPDLSDYYEI